MATDETLCSNCKRLLDPTHIVHLELDERRNLWIDPLQEYIEEEDSRGCFPFGADCAKTILANGGKCVPYWMRRGGG